MATKYTVGPWSVDTCDIGLVTADCDGMAVASADMEDRNDEEVSANVRLIASAPDLAEALRQICQLTVGWCNAATAARCGEIAFMALRKATVEE